MTRRRAQTHTQTISGLNYCLHEWDGGGEVTIILLHGFLDVGLSWSFVAEALADTNFHLVAPDWRGHGESDWLGDGGYYHFVDYVRDLEQIVAAFRRQHVLIVGHSMGAMAALLWAGARPEQLDALMVVDGTGPLPVSAGDYPERVARWLEQVAPFRASGFTRSMATLDDVIGRLKRSRPNQSHAVLSRLAEFSTRRGEDGLLYWKHDPLHRTKTPLPVSPDVVDAFWTRIRCPIFWVSGERSPWNYDTLTAWIEAHPMAQRQVLSGVGHMVHTEAAESLAKLLRKAVQSVGI
ncbi:MAG: alpha/beta hydrolase [Myxococcota bacterium]|nr:alpha/beta hydrolase [Myxococcota bacterium]